MTKEESINLIKQALEVATRKGCFGLAEIEIILSALKGLETPDEEE